MLLFAATTLCLLGSTIAGNSATTFPRVSPKYQNAFQQSLPISPVKKPLTSYTNPSSGGIIDFYEVEVMNFKHKFFPDLPGSSELIGYDGSYPGPTFRVEKGRETVVRFVNKAAQKMNVHLHGSYTWDGWALDWLEPGQYKDYYYPNAAHRTLWYHDHTNKVGAMNVYKGLLGMYQIVDSKLDASLGLPSGGQYDVPLILTSHYFTRDGGLSNEERQTTSIYGDTFLVNGQIQPYHPVEPRKYRFRILNAAVSRVFNLTLLADDTPVEMSIVGSDGGYRQSPVSTKDLMIEMSARWEVIIDFAKYAGKNLTLTTTNAWTDTAYADTDQIMRFVVGKTVSDQTGNAALPSRFNYDMKFPTDTRIAAERTIKLDSHMDSVWGMNGIHHDDAMSRVMMRPPLGTVEKYTFKSTGMGMTTGGRTGSADPSLKPDSASGGMGGMMGGGNMASHHGGGGMTTSEPSTKPSSDSVAGSQSMAGGHMASHHGGGGGMMGMGMKKIVQLNKRQMMGMGGAAWTHAMHMHLVDMKIVSRRKDDPAKAEGRDYLEEYEKDSIKDVVLLGSNEVVKVLAKYVPYPGVYMFHCHNSVHSDQGMMGIFNVTRLQDLGYKELEARLEDPMDARFRAKAYTGTNIEVIRSEILPSFASLGAYPDGAALSEMEDRYWSTRTPPTAADTGMLTPHIPGLADDVPSHHRGEAPMPPKAPNSNAGSAGMGGVAGMNMGGDVAGHHGGTGMKATPSAPKSSSTDKDGMAGMHMRGDIAGHRGGAGMPNASPTGVSGVHMAGHHP
ncbi:Cupredoxin [Tothia fuscella]|uniref:Cupredoxin n=1 Tax=Tothia fuscella TaxID=1048955 RepID=A0A9P4U1A7_9PEZI|nr:Cupredoxin [Tothia fuscella]